VEWVVVSTEEDPIEPLISKTSIKRVGRVALGVSEADNEMWYVFVVVSPTSILSALIVMGGGGTGGGTST